MPSWPAWKWDRRTERGGLHTESEPPFDKLRAVSEAEGTVRERVLRTPLRSSLDR